jgi:O-antigen ligase
LVVYLTLPSIGRETAAEFAGSMRGVYAQKNTLGSAATLAVTCYLYEFIAATRYRNRALLAIAFLIGCEAFAQAATATLISAITIFYAIYYRHRMDGRFRIVLIFLGLSFFSVLATFLVIDADLVFGAIGRDSSLSGRTPLWIYSTQAAMARPFFGYGFSSFWVADSRTTQWIWAMLGGWKAPGAHNGYLDIVLQLGIVGLGLYLFIWAMVIRRAMSVDRDGTVPEAGWILSFMLLNFILNLDEGPLPFADQFTVMMPVAILFLADRVGRASYNIAAVHRRSSLPPHTRN